MMQILQKNRSLIIAIAIFAAVIWGYSTFFKTDSSVTVDVDTQAVGSDVLALYSSLQSVSIDQSIFASPLYKNLTDFSRALENQPIGRANPFDVIGRD
jgi:hypothetical protein